MCIHQDTAASVSEDRSEFTPADTIAALSSLTHPNVVAVLNCYETRNHLWLIHDYYTGGTLRTILAEVCLVVLLLRLVGACVRACVRGGAAAQTITHPRSHTPHTQRTTHGSDTHAHPLPQI